MTIARAFTFAFLLAACDPVDAGEDAGNGNGDGRFMISAPFSDAPEYMVPDDAPPGAEDSFELASSEATHFMIDVESGEPFTRAITVWIPSQYVAGTAAPFIVLQDGTDYYYDLIPVLVTLIHERRIPPVVVIAIAAGPGGAVGERSLEYDTLSDEYVRFVEDDVLPRVRERYSVELTDDPDGRAAMGGSSGGAAAFTMGWFRPDLYRRILTYSGTFVNQHPDDTYPRGAWEYHATLIPEDDVKPLRVFLEAGTDDFDWNEMAGDEYHRWLDANRAMYDVLSARGYRVRYVEAEGAGHVDSGAIRQTLPSALEWLWQGYPIP
jgi:enterochelin esterase family protein